MAKNNSAIRFEAFEDDSSSIVVNGVEVGHIEREVTVDWDRYDSSTSRCTKRFERVSGYTITLWDDRVGEAIAEEADALGTCKTLKQARDAARALVAKAPL